MTPLITIYSIRTNIFYQKSKNLILRTISPPLLSRLKQGVLSREFLGSGRQRTENILIDMLETNLDHLAQQSTFRHIHPGTKFLLAAGSLTLSLISPSPLLPFLTGIILSLVLIIPGRLPLRVYGEILSGPAVFILMGTAVLLFMQGGGEILWRFHPVPWINLTITSGAVQTGIFILSRVFGCSVSLFFLTLTTPVTDLFNGMKRIGIPGEIIDLMMIVYRYIFIISAMAVEIWKAQVMRLGYHRPGEAVRSFSTLCGMLFISSWNAGEDLVHAMDCRCYAGILPSLDHSEPVQMPSLLLVILYLAGLCGILLSLNLHPGTGIW
jgi:cobalt/nickel transport system permease protein